jgi:uncharacterized membrane protein YdbT with pleckstrin-like domain
MKLLNSIIFYLILNVLLAIVMFVSGFEFVFPQEWNNQSGSYVMYGLLEFVISVITIVTYFNKQLFGEDK